MKNKFFSISSVAALAAFAIGGTQLQAAANAGVSVKVPFEFVVSGKTMPAGNYTILSSGMNQPIFFVRDMRTRRGALISMNWDRAADGYAPTQSRVQFACRADTCYLQKLEVEGSSGFVARIPKLKPAQKERTVALAAKPITAGD